MNNITKCRVCSDDLTAKTFENCCSKECARFKFLSESIMAL